MTVQLFGDFIEHFPPEQDCLEMLFTPSSYPIRKRWRTHRLSAHFIADYFVNFLPVDEEDRNHERRVKESKGAVSYVANELLENAIKFNDETSHYKVRFGIHFIEGQDLIAAIFTTNSIKLEQAQSFQVFIQKLLAGDPGELYIQHLEHSVETESESSGLGLLTMMNDYAARLGWRFEECSGDYPLVTVTTMAQINL